MPMNALIEIDAVVEARRLELWERCLDEALQRLNLELEQRDSLAFFRREAQVWTCQQLAVFLRDTEAAIWAVDREELASHGKVWAGRFIVAQVELGQRLGQWPPELDPPCE